MKFDSYSYSIAEYYLPALINSDLTGMEYNELVNLSDFEKSLPDGMGHWSMPDPTESVSFKRCEVSGLYANCHDMEYLVLSNKE